MTIYNIIKFKVLVIIIISIVISSCNFSNNDSSIDTIKKTKDSLTEKPVNNIKVDEKIIDSVKMHAFDNIYFGKNYSPKTNSHTINDMEYTVTSAKSLPNEGLFYIMLENQSKITTERKARQVLNDLKNTITKKYSKSISLNKTFYVKHPEEDDKRESSFSNPRNQYKYDEKIIGLPYEFAGYRWDLKYKDIQLGYLIDNKNRTRFYQSNTKNDLYIIYVEFKSKVIKPKKTDLSSKKVEQDSKKF
ncbi:hypothetical protein J2X31_000261 [Flavobacterium arsenatis]|uniref:Lipoprotein n=1 Tax=Flavobacterium arsenatis TaxID=1484332 RepID=A0ABU1TJW8_9FLAO|nr:hypothetical protein [Flavobacterium arsenatis]MDR6966268.1 hypothetical protein [Flavobacterium arsenatis]